MDAVRFKGARVAAKIDQQVGDRIRRRRTMLGFTQEQLAEALEISYQQVQKYETGANRVSAGRLFQIAQRLEVNVAYFFDDLGIDYGAEESSGRASFELVRSYNQITDPSVRSAVSGLVKALANRSGAGESMEGMEHLMFAGRGGANGGSTNGGSGAGGDHTD